jgi:hypothetical protein
MQRKKGGGGNSNICGKERWRDGGECGGRYVRRIGGVIEGVVT